MAARILTARLGRRTAWLQTDAAGVRRLLDQVGTPRIYDRQRGCWTVPLDRVSDVITAAEHSRPRWHVTVVNDRQTSLDDIDQGSA